MLRSQKPYEKKWPEVTTLEGSRPAGAWKPRGKYLHDPALLRKLIQVAVDTGRAGKSTTGGVALAIDVWVACELRRAGFDPDGVWPRAESPRTLPPSFAQAVENYPFLQNQSKREGEERAISRLTRALGKERTRIQGGQLAKEIDVAIGDFERGPELVVSTKAITSSYGNNITNRWEEATGDLANLRGRFPLATIGFALLVTKPILKEENSWARAKDMLRKLREENPGAPGLFYDGTCLVVADWDGGTAKTYPAKVPKDLAPNQFFEALIPTLFTRSPVLLHAKARERWEDSNPPGHIP
jgi:hypothetical protein